jgi:hypothetical protein
VYRSVGFSTSLRVSFSFGFRFLACLFIGLALSCLAAVMIAGML